ncbi:putative mitochondrial inheritance component mdm12 [Rosellinia necatrix]|uniref:Mitochondrial distribution and morphology protein 12 n=1 Tax=Rosellinia necatrix TaxID=77044 RepID=A0A1S7ULQ5_ROSNE|nr:putative mitochondrial inheritance component mdm12 [Rosellinia necatrix]
MSIDLNWETLTGGPDGAALAEHIRDFIHVKFQAVPLPRFIKSVTVHEFDFGKIPPSVVLKDISDPLPDFYEDDYESDEEEDAGGHEDDDEGVPDAIRAAERRRRAEQRAINEGGGGGGGGATGRAAGNASGTTTPFGEGFFPPHVHSAGLRNAPGTAADLASPFLGLGMSAHGIPGGPSGMHYFQSKLGPGWSGTQTPLAAAAAAAAASAGAQHLNGWLDATAAQAQARRLPAQAQMQMQTTSHSYRSSSNNSGRHRHLSQGSISVENFPSSSVVGAGGSNSTLAVPSHPLREKHSVSTLAPTSEASAGASRPPTREGPGTSPLAGGSLSAGSAAAGTQHGSGGGFRNEKSQAYSKSKATAAVEDDDDDDDDKGEVGKAKKGGRKAADQEPRTDDMQAVFRIRYAGDVRLELTAMILLDYPMPSFVGIPLKLNITGLTFDGVGVIAYIRKRVHFCFLSPEDAIAAVGEDDDGDGDGDEGDDEARAPAPALAPPPPEYYHQQHQQQHYQAGSRPATRAGPGNDAARAEDRTPRSRGKGRMGGLLQEIRVESEIGQREGSKQSLKNVGKVEKFVLEQVRRIFEEEFVYPSFWTFLV